VVRYKIEHSFSYPYPTKWGRYNMFFIILWYRFRNYFYDRPPAWCQHSLKLERVVTTANAVGTNSLTCLPKHRGARDSKFWSPIRWRTILDRTLSALTAAPSSVSENRTLANIIDQCKKSRLRSVVYPFDIGKSRGDSSFVVKWNYYDLQGPRVIDRITIH
jgi:hypothetical protein